MRVSHPTIKLLTPSQSPLHASIFEDKNAEQTCTLLRQKPRYELEERIDQSLHLNSWRFAKWRAQEQLFVESPTQ